MMVSGPFTKVAHQHKMQVQLPVLQSNHLVEVAVMLLVPIRRGAVLGVPCLATPLIASRVSLLAAIGLTVSLHGPVSPPVAPVEVIVGHWEVAVTGPAWLGHQALHSCHQLWGACRQWAMLSVPRWAVALVLPWLVGQ